MCFHIHRRHREEKIASRDITCYKKLTIEFYSLTNKPIIISKESLPTIKFRTPFRDAPVSLYKSPLKTAIIKVVPSPFTLENRIENGLHSYSSIRKAMSATYKREVIVKCTIPKGSKYYYNPENQEYVSNQLQYSIQLRNKSKMMFNINKKLLF